MPPGSTSAAASAASMRASSFAASHENERNPGDQPCARAASGNDCRYAPAFEQRPGTKTVRGAEPSRARTIDAGRSPGTFSGSTRAGGGVGFGGAGGGGAGGGGDVGFAGSPRIGAIGRASAPTRTPSAP